MSRTLKSRRLVSAQTLNAMLPAITLGALYLGATSAVYAASGDGPVAGAIVDEFDVLYGTTTDVVITTACLEGNPFVPDQPPPELTGIPTLSGCKLDIPVGSTEPDNAQLITVLPNNFKNDDLLTSVYTYGTGSSTALETNVTVRAVSKDVFIGLADPALFGADPQLASDVETTADAFCTSIDGTFVCAQVEPCLDPNGCSSDAACGGLSIAAGADQFCADLTGVLEASYNLERNPLAYAISTDMSNLAQPGSVTLRVCPGFRAQCLPPGAFPIASNVQVTTMHTQAAFVETPRLRLPYY